MKTSLACTKSFFFFDSVKQFFFKKKKWRGHAKTRLLTCVVPTQKPNVTTLKKLFDLNALVQCVGRSLCQLQTIANTIYGDVSRVSISFVVLQLHLRYRCFGSSILTCRINPCRRSTTMHLLTMQDTIDPVTRVFEKEN